MNEQTLAVAALTAPKETMLAAAKLSAADLKAESKSDSVTQSRFSSVDSFDTLLSAPTASPPSTPGRSDDDLLVSRHALCRVSWLHIQGCSMSAGRLSVGC